MLSGASGMLGSALRDAFAARRLETLQLVRRAPRAPSEVEWNPAAAAAIPNPEPLEGITAAIHLSGSNLAAHRWTAAYKREMLASRVDSTRVLARLLAGLRRPPRTLLVASATGIYGDRGDEILDESSATGTGFLAQLCQDWEAAARPAVEAGIRVAHLRFGVVLGPGTGALARMVPIFRLGLGGRLGNGRQWMSWIGLADLVAAILFILENPALAGPVNLTAPNPVTNAGFTRALIRALHRPAILPAPAFALRLVLGPMAREALLASARVQPARLIEAGFRFSQPIVEEALAAALAQPRPASQPALS
ncbi:MAG: TIGR01777 family oxidoreductase [Acidobacteriota bacterium]|nr:TIGR01777 family oxidoreductase [Acidobacteriota bacterium]